MSKKPTLLVVFLTVLVDLIGFGIVLPLLPVFANRYGASAFLVGVIMASFSAMQFLFSPIWGRLSDRVGRRPVIMTSTAVACLSYLVFAFGCRLPAPSNIALWIFLISRMIAGACGANLTVAQAYIADITPPADRSKRMGLIGMAFGLGFIMGPPLGGLAVKYWGSQGPGLAAALICALNFISAAIILKESWTPKAEHTSERPHWAQCMHILRQPVIGLLVMVYFLSTVCFACFETTLGLLVCKNFGLNLDNAADAMKITYLFTYCGLVGAFVQGGMTGRLVKSMGEPKVIALSMILVAISFFPMAFILHWKPLYVAIGILAIGSSLARPPLFGMLSRLTPPDKQGETLGVAQSAGSLGRIVGPLCAGGLMVGHLAAPYVVFGIVALLTGVFVGRLESPRA